MSGIAALVHFDGRPADPARIETMTAAMAHRGPDGITHWVQGSVALGQCTLHVTAEATEAVLPLVNAEAQVALVMAGRVDNYDELRTLLTGRGAVLRSRADEEMVLQAYLLFGAEMTAHLEGDFAIVIWDGRRGEVLCLRDPFAHKPVHYTWDGTTLGIASDVAALLALPGVSAEIDLATVVEVIECDWVSHTDTFYRQIKRLPAASRLVCDRQGPRISRYWTPDPFAPSPVRNEAEAAAAYLELFTASVRRRSRAHLPVAYEVSGGLDSSAVFAVAQDLAGRGALPAPEIHGYTLRIEGDAAANDLPFARAVAAHLGVPLAEVPPTLKPPEWFRARAAAMRDHPGFPNGVMHEGLIRQAQQDGCRVLIDGIGGDEWLSGNRWLDYADAVRAGDLRALFGIMHADAPGIGWPAASARALRYGLGSNLPGPIRAAMRRTPLSGRQKHAGPVWATDKLLKKLAKRREDCARPERKLRFRSQLELDRSLFDAYGVWAREINERTAAHLQIERRSPFEDRALVEFVYTLPGWFMRKGPLIKHFHRTALQGLLPESVRMRADKAVFDTVMTAGVDDVAQAVVANTPDAPALISEACLSRLQTQSVPDLRDGDEMVDFRLWALCGIQGLFSRPAIQP